MDEIERKSSRTITLSHRQLGTGATLIAVIAVLTPIKDWLYTRGEGEAQARHMAELSTSIREIKLDLSNQIDHNTNTILDRIKEAETRMVKNEDRLEQRVDSVEVALRLKTNKNN